jgi:hypothetical protein
MAESIDLSLGEYLLKIFSTAPVGETLANEIKHLTKTSVAKKEDDPMWAHSAEGAKHLQREVLLENLAAKILEEKASVVAHNLQATPAISEETFSTFIRLILKNKGQLLRGTLSKLEQKKTELIPAERTFTLTPPFQALWSEIEESLRIVRDKTRPSTTRSIYDIRLGAYLLIFKVNLLESLPASATEITEDRCHTIIDEHWNVHLETWS